MVEYIKAKIIWGASEVHHGGCLHRLSVNCNGLHRITYVLSMWIRVVSVSDQNNLSSLQLTVI